MYIIRSNVLLMFERRRSGRQLANLVMLFRENSRYLFNSTDRFVGKLFEVESLEEFMPFTISNNSVLLHGFRNVHLSLESPK